MQQSEKTAPEPKTQGNGCLGLEGKGGVIQAKFAHALLEFLVIRGVDRVKSAENHRTNLLIRGASPRSADSARVRVSPILISATSRMPVTNAPDLPLDESFVRNRLGAELSEFLDLSLPSRSSGQDPVLRKLPRKHTDITNHTLECVELVIEDQGPRFRCSSTSAEAMNHRFQNLVYSNARLSACLDGILGGNGKDILDLLGHPIDAGWQIHLVDHGNDIQSLSIRKLAKVCQSLGLDSLRRIDQKQGRLRKPPDFWKLYRRNRRTGVSIKLNKYSFPSWAQ